MSMLEDLQKEAATSAAPSVDQTKPRLGMAAEVLGTPTDSQSTGSSILGKVDIGETLWTTDEGTEIKATEETPIYEVSKMDDEEYSRHLERTQPKQEEYKGEEADWADYVEFGARAATSGVTTAGHMLAGVVSGLTGSADPDDDPFWYAVNEHATKVADALKGTSEMIEEEYHPEIKHAMQQKVFYKDETGHVRFNMPNLTQITGTILQSFTLGGGIATVGKGLSTTIGALGTSKAFANVIGQGAASAGFISGMIYEEIKNEAINQGASPAEAHAAGVEGVKLFLPVGFVTGGIGGALAVGAKGKLPTRMAKGGAVEAIPEGIEEGWESISKDMALKGEVDYLEAASGAVLGAIGGVGSGAGEALFAGSDTAQQEISAVEDQLKKIAMAKARHINAEREAIQAVNIPNNEVRTILEQTEVATKVKLTIPRYNQINRKLEELRKQWEGFEFKPLEQNILDASETEQAPLEGEIIPAERPVAEDAPEGVTIEGELAPEQKRLPAPEQVEAQVAYEELFNSPTERYAFETARHLETELLLHKQGAPSFEKQLEDTVRAEAEVGEDTAVEEPVIETVDGEEVVSAPEEEVVAPAAEIVEDEEVVAPAEPKEQKSIESLSNEINTTKDRLDEIEGELVASDYLDEAEILALKREQRALNNKVKALQSQAKSFVPEEDVTVDDTYDEDAELDIVVEASTKTETPAKATRNLTETPKRAKDADGQTVYDLSVGGVDFRITRNTMGQGDANGVKGWYVVPLDYSNDPTLDGVYLGDTQKDALNKLKEMASRGEDFVVADLYKGGIKYTAKLSPQQSEPTTVQKVSKQEVAKAKGETIKTPAPSTPSLEAVMEDYKNILEDPSTENIASIASKYDMSIKEFESFVHKVVSKATLRKRDTKAPEYVHSAPKMASLQKAVDTFVSKTPQSPKVFLHASPDNMPMYIHMALLDKTTGENTVDGVTAVYIMNGSTPEVHILANRMKDANEVRATLYHEIAAHYGLRAVFNKDFDAFLDMTYKNERIRVDVAKLAASLGHDVNTDAGRREATEEYIARLAEQFVDSKKRPGILNRLIASVKHWLRKRGLDWKVLEITDAEILAQVARADKRLRGRTAVSVNDAGVRLSFIGKNAKTHANTLTSAQRLHSELLAERKAQIPALQEQLDAQASMLVDGLSATETGRIQGEIIATQKQIDDLNDPKSPNLVEEIRQQTGWFLHRDDNQWRYELSDKDAKINIVPDKEGKTTGTLGELLTHDELFAAYPSLKKLSVEIEIDGDVMKPFGRHYNNSVSVTAGSYMEAKAMLLHEVQHAIQAREHFARGGSPEEFKTVEIGEKVPEAWEYYVKNIAPKKTMLEQAKGKRKELLQQSLDFHIEKYAHMVYSKLSGEIESREVSDRIEYSQEELYSNPPKYQGIPSEQVLVDMEEPTYAAASFLAGDIKGDNREQFLESLVDEIDKIETIDTIFDDHDTKGWFSRHVDSINTWINQRGPKFMRNWGPLGRMPHGDIYAINRAQVLGMKDRGEMLASHVWDKFKDLDQTTKDQLYEYFTTKNYDVRMLPAKVQKTAQVAKSAIEKFGKMAVDLGLLNETKYEENKGSYVPRMYLKYLTEDSSLKTHRGRIPTYSMFMQRQNIPEDRRKIILGQITDPAYLIAETLGVMSRELSMINMYSNIVDLSANINKQRYVLERQEIPALKEKLEAEIKAKQDSDGVSYNQARTEVMSESPLAIQLKKLQNKVSKMPKLEGAGVSAGKRPFVWMPDMVTDPTTGQEIPINALKQQRTDIDNNMTLLNLSSTEYAHAKAIRDKMDTVINEYEVAKEQQLVDFAEEMSIPVTDLDQLKKKHYKQLPNNRKFGMLAGAYIRKEIYEDMVGIYGYFDDTPHSIFSEHGSLAKLNAAWKTSKTALNIPTHVRNAIGNFVLLDISSPSNSGKLSGDVWNAFGAAILDKNVSAKWQNLRLAAVRNGIHASTFSEVELSKIRRSYTTMQKELAKDPKFGKLGVMGMWTKDKAFVAMEKLMGAYGRSEEVFKLAKMKDYIDNLEKSTGKKYVSILKTDPVLAKQWEEAAAQSAQKWIFDYSAVPAWIRAARRLPIGAPFVTFAYKALPRSIEAVARHPHKFAKYALIPMMMTQWFLHENDLDDDEWEQVMGKLPEYMRENPYMMPLPFRDDNGKIQFFDYGYFIPWAMHQKAATGLIERIGDSTDAYSAMENVGLGGLQAAQDMGFLGGPIPTLISLRLSGGIDPFTKRPVITDDMPARVRFERMSEYSWRMAMPTFMTDIGVLGKVLDHFEIDAGALSTGDRRNKFGTDKMDLSSAMLRGVGMNIYHQDPEESNVSNIKNLRYKLNRAKAERTKALKYAMAQRKGIVEINKIREEYNSMILQRKKELVDYIKGTQQ